MSPRSDEFPRFVVVDERRWPVLIILPSLWFEIFCNSRQWGACSSWWSRAARGWRGAAPGVRFLFSVVVERLRGASVGEFALFIDCRAYILSRIYLFACVGICSFIYCLLLYFLYIYLCVSFNYFSRVHRYTVAPWAFNETFIYRWSPYYLPT